MGKTTLVWLCEGCITDLELKPSGTTMLTGDSCALCAKKPEKLHGYNQDFVTNWMYSKDFGANPKTDTYAEVVAELEAEEPENPTTDILGPDVRGVTTLLKTLRKCILSGNCTGEMLATIRVYSNGARALWWWCGTCKHTTCFTPAQAKLDTRVESVKRENAELEEMAARIQLGAA